MEIAISTEIELTLHHIKENGDGGFAKLYFRGQCDLQNGTHHGRDEFDFVGTWNESKKIKIISLEVKRYNLPPQGPWEKSTFMWVDQLHSDLGDYMLYSDNKWTS